MRTTPVTQFTDYYEDRNFYQVTYPEDYIFVHSRHTYLDLVELRDADYVPNSGALVTLEIIDNTTSTTYSEARYANQLAKATWDIGRFLQIFMDGTLKPDADFDYTGNSRMVASHSVTLNLHWGGVVFWTHDFEIVNGADEPIDCWWDSQRRLRWWYNYPFTFDFRNLPDASVVINNGTAAVLNLPQITPDTMTYSRIRINPKCLTSSANTMRVLSQGGMGFYLGSFSGNRTDSVLLIGNGCKMSNQNIYLRWLNRHGELSYWLFNRYSKQRTIKAADYQGAYIKDERFAGQATCDNSLLRTLTVQGELKGFTDALDGIDYEIVRQLFTAPFVDMLLPEHSGKYPVWQRVNIKAENQTEPLRHSDDYTQNRQVTITVTLPEEGQIFV